MTPFILAVLCLVSCERLPRFTSLYGPIFYEVHSLLVTSPAGSWKVTGAAETENIMLAATSPTEIEEDTLDPELGIGPEEIVGACILAMYWRNTPEEAASIAAYAFTWARGWIKVSNNFTGAIAILILMRNRGPLQVLKGPDRSTCVELFGMVPAERKANEDDMARVWLLCYVS